MKKFIYIAILLVFSAWMVSCDVFLTTDNKSNVTDKEYFSTKSGFESLVSNAYEDVYKRQARYIRVNDKQELQR